jgi:5S rRNA maturation endonuclease (ribonuclease M5)
MSSDIASLSLSQIARLLGGKVSRNGNSQSCVIAPGPNHSAKDGSLSVTLAATAPDGFLVHSFADDDPITCKDWVRERLGLPPFEPSRKRGNGRAKPTKTTTNATPEEIKAANAAAREAMAASKGNSGGGGAWKVVREHIYRDERGESYLKVRKCLDDDGRKQYPQFHLENGQWVKGKPKGSKIPYHLPELVATPLNATIFFCEGEKDSDALAKLNFISTTASEGAGAAWDPALTKWFKDRPVVILPDADKPGRKHAEKVAKALNNIATSVKIVDLFPDRTDGSDVSDFLADDRAGSRLAKLIKDAPEWEAPDDTSGGDGIMLGDFYAYMPMHTYIFTPSREMWPASSVNAQIPPIMEADKPVKASAWLDSNRAVTQMTWAPGLPLEIADRIISDGGWSERNGIICLNLYKPPAIRRGNATGADRWIEHVRKVYPDDADHIIQYLAHRVQRPQEKINHALFLGGSPGIGKDTLLAPVKTAIGPWNFQEVSPKTMLGNFNGFAKSVILRVSEARDLGDVNRYSFYDATKTYAAAPPDVLRVNEKNLREYYISNVCAVVITSNYKSDGLYLPADDRRHYVAWSDLTVADFADGYWNSLWGWYGNGGEEDVAAYLGRLDLSRFDPKAPPAKTAAFWAIVDANLAPEEAELADALDKLGRPDALTLIDIMREIGSSSFADWLTDRKNRRAIPHRFEQCGYVPVRNQGANSGLWVIRGTRQVIYAKAELSVRDRFAAASALIRKH